MNADVVPECERKTAKYGKKGFVVTGEEERKIERSIDADGSAVKVGERVCVCSWRNCERKVLDHLCDAAGSSGERQICDRAMACARAGDVQVR